MATSDRRRAANRANAQHSTGPRTDAGKRKVARNALVHGFTRRGPLLASDDVRDYQRFAARMLRDLKPDGAMQEQLAEEIINYSWRLRRAPRAERLLFDKHHRAFNPDPVLDPRLEMELLDMEIEEEQIHGVPPEQEILGYDDVVTDQTPSGLLSVMVEKRDSKRNEPDSPVWRLDRYVVRIERARASALRLLLALQRRDEENAEEDDDDDEDLIDDAAEPTVFDSPAPSAAPLEGPPVVANPASDVPPLAVSQTEAGDDAAHRTAKPQAEVEAALTDLAGVEVAEQNSDPQNKPNEESTQGETEVAASNGDAVNNSSDSAFPDPGTKPNPEPIPDTPLPVEPGRPIGESPPPTT